MDRCDVCRPLSKVDSVGFVFCNDEVDSVSSTQKSRFLRDKILISFVLCNHGVY
ncbi:hypothetical protein Fmac_008257 [Flemingia macrophylla]|uniref:Uncharacterized protein n=1 Tax=Flemingia macrophylla TaxID=520843 RepID=A0ABD1MWW3_9FABA